MLDYEVDILTIPAAVFNKVLRADKAAAADILDKADVAQAAMLESKYMKPEEGGGFIVGLKNSFRKAHNAVVDLLYTEMPVRNINGGHQMSVGSMHPTIYPQPRVMVASSFLKAALLDRVSSDAPLAQAAGVTEEEIEFLRNAPPVAILPGSSFASNL